MHLCICVSEEGRDEEGAGSDALSLLSLDTHRKEVAGAHGTYTQETPSHLRQNSSGHVALSALLRQAARNLCCNLTPERILSGIVIIQWYRISNSLQQRLSSSLLHMSGTFKTIGTANATCAAARCVTLLTRCNHPRVGQNLLMAGADRLSGGTGTPAVSQRSESGQGILGAKAGRGMLLWSAVVVAVLSSRMSAGGCSLAGRRDNVPCLATTNCFVF
jgi:hypothetical protein